MDEAAAGRRNGCSTAVQARGAGCRRPARTPVWSCGKWRDGAAKDRSGDTEGQRAGCRRPAGGGQGWAMGEMGNRPGGGGDFGRAKRRRQDLEIARGESREIGEGVGLRRSTYQCKAYSNRVGKKLRPILLYRSRGQEMGDGHLGRQKPEQVKSVVGRLDPGSRETVKFPRLPFYRIPAFFKSIQLRLSRTLSDRVSPATSSGPGLVRVRYG